MKSPSEQAQARESDPLINATDAEKKHGFPRVVLLRMARLGLVPSIKLGTRVYFLESDLVRVKREGAPLHRAPDQAATPPPRRQPPSRQRQAPAAAGRPRRRAAG